MKRRNLLLGGGALAAAGIGATWLRWRDVGSMEDYDAAIAPFRAVLGRAPAIPEFIRYATLAPSGHNTQPWRFRVGVREVSIVPDLARRTPVVDPDDHHLFVALGCAAENLALAAAARGQKGELRLDPAMEGSIAFAFGSGTDDDLSLFDAIPARQSTRADYDGRPVSADDLRALAAAANVPGVDLALILDRAGIDHVRDLVVAGNEAQMADAAFVRELKSWIRFNPRQAALTGDGLFTAASGNPVLPAWVGRHAFDWTFKAASENEKYRGQIASSSGIAVFAGLRADREHWSLVGRACQRFALRATALGLKVAFVNQPVEVPQLRPSLASLIGLPGRRPDLVMRFGYGPALPYSSRRPTQALTL